MSNRIAMGQGKPTLDDDEELIDLTALDAEEEDEDEEEGSVEASTTKTDKPVIPEKFKGKSITDIISSYENLEREYGRRNNEVGQLRKLTDQLLDLKPQPKEEAQEENKLDADSLLEDPATAIQKAVDNNPTLKAIQERLVSGDRATAKKAFEDKHPDWEATMKDEKFAAWIMKSAVRQKEFLEADQNYDYATGAQLLDDFKELYPSQEANGDADAEAEEEKVNEAAKAISTEKKSKSRASTKKIYSRAQIIQLAVDNPAEYERRQGEFRLAYEENRVR